MSQVSSEGGQSIAAERVRRRKLDVKQEALRVELTVWTPRPLAIGSQRLQGTRTDLAG
jgi:hypothetical protein